MGVAAGMGATVKPYHHRQWLDAGGISPEIEIKTVLAARKVASAPDEFVLAKGLIAGIPRGCGASDTGPGCHSLRRTPAQLVDRRRGERQAMKGSNLLFVIGPYAAHAASLGWF